MAWKPVVCFRNAHGGVCAWRKQHAWSERVAHAALIHLRPYFSIHQDGLLKAVFLSGSINFDPIEVLAACRICSKTSRNTEHALHSIDARAYDNYFYVVRSGEASGDPGLSGWQGWLLFGEVRSCKLYAWTWQTK